MTEQKFKRPIKQKTLTRILMAVIVFFIFVASYYRSKFVLERRKYNALEDKYVRVREMLGVDKTQDLIDQSYE